MVITIRGLPIWVIANFCVISFYRIFDADFRNTYCSPGIKKKPT